MNSFNMLSYDTNILIQRAIRTYCQLLLYIDTTISILTSAKFVTKFAFGGGFCVRPQVATFPQSTPHVPYYSDFVQGHQLLSISIILFGGRLTYEELAQIPKLRPKHSCWVKMRNESLLREKWFILILCWNLPTARNTTAIQKVGLHTCAVYSRTRDVTSVVTSVLSNMNENSNPLWQNGCQMMYHFATVQWLNSLWRRTTALQIPMGDFVLHLFNGYQGFFPWE